MKRKKIAIIGAGMTGATIGHWCASKELGDIVFIDIMEDMPQGKALDLAQAGPIEGFDVRIEGSNDFASLAGADVVAITAGSPRKPGMSRSDLLNINAKIVGDAAGNVAKYAPDAFIIVLTNPLDVMTYVAHKASGFPTHRVMGQSGVLDTTRFRHFIAEELNVSVEDVTSLVLGGHGDSMVPLVRYTYAGGIPVETLMPADRLQALVDRARTGGAEIVNLLKTGSAFYAPSSAVTQMIEAIVKDKKRILPVAAYLDGEYGLSGHYMGVPVILGGGGVERILEIELTPEEREAFQRSADDVMATQREWEQAAADA